MSLENRDYEQLIGKGSSSLECADCNVTIKAGDNKQTQILTQDGEIIASFDEATKLTTLDTLKVTNDTSLDGNATVKGNLTADSNLLVNGNTTLGDDSSDTIEIKGTSAFKEDIQADKNLTVDGVTKLNGDTFLGDTDADTIRVKGVLVAEEDTELKKDLYVNGDVVLGNETSDKIIFNGTPQFKDIEAQNLTIKDNTTLGEDSTDTLTVKATSTFKEDMTAEKGLSVGNNLSVADNTTLGEDSTDTLTVKATSTFKEDMTAEKGLEVQGDTDLQGNVNLGSDNTDSIIVKGVSTFNENVTAKKNVYIEGALTADGNTTLGDSPTDNTLINGTLQAKEKGTFEKDLEVQGNTTLGDADSDTLTVKATSTFEEKAHFKKCINLGTDTDDCITFNNSSTFFEVYRDNNLIAELKGFAHKAGTDDRKKIIQGISRYVKDYTPLPSAFENDVTIVGGDYKGGGNIDPFSLIVDVQGEMAFINLQFRVKNLNEQIPSTDLTKVNLDLKGILGDFTPITTLLDTWFVGVAYYTIPANPNAIPFYPTFSKIENNKDVDFLIFEVPESKNVTYGNPRDIDGVWFRAEIMARVQLDL